MENFADRTDAPPANREGTPQCPPNKWLVFFLAAIAVFMSTLDSSIVNIGLPVIMKDFQVPLSTIEWVPIVYLLTVSSLLLTFGRLSDIYGRRRVYCMGFVVFSLGSLCCGAAGSAGWLIGFRAFQGAGAAMLMACTPALVVDAFPIAERGRALGMVGTVVAAGLSTGPAVGGLILAHFPWPVIFYINIPIGIAATLAASAVLGRMEETRQKEPLDWAGAVLLVVCLSALIIGLTHLNDWGPSSSKTGLAGVLFAGSGLALAAVETRSDHPIFDPSLLRVRLFALSVASAIVLFVSLFVVTFLMPFYLVHPMGFPMDRVGGIMMIPFLLLFFVAPVSGILSDRFGSRMLCTLGMTVVAAALFFLSRLSAAATVPDIAWRLALIGIGIAIFISPNSAAAMSAVPPRHRGVAAGSVATARNLGMVVGVAVAGLIFNATFRSMTGGLDLKVYTPNLAPHFMTAFRSAMMTGAAAAGIGIVLAFLRGAESNRAGAVPPTAH